MLVCLLYALVLGFFSAVAVIASWHFAAKNLDRPPWARLVGAALGALAGAVLAHPLVETVVLAMGYRSEAAGLMIAFTFPFFLPISVALGGWLFSEVVGGRSQRPWRTLGLGFAGAFAGAAPVVIFLYSSLARSIPSSLGHVALVAIPSAACVLGIWFAQRGR